MIRKETLLLLLIALLSLTIIGLAQTGTFSGSVVDSAGIPVAGAEVELFEDGGCGGGGMGGGGGGGGGGMQQDPLYETTTLEDGTFIIEGVDVGEYEAKAHLQGYGMDTEDIEIFAGQTTTVDFVLSGCGGGGGGGGMGGWTGLTTVELEGTAIVEEFGMMMDHYYLDVDGDLEPDYQLMFGPSWYDPQSGAERPENGDEITIVGGLDTASVNQMVVVYEINGLFWREPIGTTPGDVRRYRERAHQQGGDSAIRTKLASYPNPFNPETTLNYELSEDASVNIAIYNALGEKVATLVNSSMNAGVHNVQWNAANYSSGFYFVKMNVNGQTVTQRLLLTK